MAIHAGCLYFQGHGAACSFHGVKHGFKARKTTGYIWIGNASMRPPHAQPGQSVVEKDGMLMLSPSMKIPNKGIGRMTHSTYVMNADMSLSVVCHLPVRPVVEEGQQRYVKAEKREEPAVRESVPAERELPWLFRWLDQQEIGG